MDHIPAGRTRMAARATMAIAVVIAASGVPATAQSPLPEDGGLVIWAQGSVVPQFTEVGKAFTEQYGVPVHVEEVALADMRDRFIRAAPAGEGPDLIINPHDVLGSLVSSSLLEPIELTDDTAAQFEPVALRAFSYDGSLYGIPYALQSNALIYNPELVPSPPSTWDELKAIARELETSGKAEHGFVLLDANPFFAYPVFTGHGGYVFGETDQGYDPNDLGLDSAGSIAAAQEIRSMVDEGLLTKGMDYETMQTLYKDGRVGMMINGPFAIADIEAAGTPFRVAPIPTMTQTPRPFVGAQGFLVSAFSKDKLLAKTFLTEFIASEAGQRLIYETGQPQPSAWASINPTIDDEIVKAFAASGANGDPTPAIPEMGFVWNAWGNALTALFAGEGDPAAVMQDAAAAIRAEIAK